MFDAALHEEGGSPVAVCRRRIFLIEAVNAPDALLRALGPFAVRQVPLDQVALVVVGATACIRIETSSLDDHHAEVVAAKLRQLPFIAAVSLGWRS